VCLSLDEQEAVECPEEIKPSIKSYNEATKSVVVSYKESMIQNGPLFSPYTASHKKSSSDISRYSYNLDTPGLWWWGE